MTKYVASSAFVLLLVKRDSLDATKWTTDGRLLSRGIRQPEKCMTLL